VKIEDLDRTVAEAHSHLSIDLQRAVARLTLRQRQALLLVYVFGLTESEAAKALGIRQQVVCRAVSAALQNLKKMFFGGVGVKSASWVPISSRRWD